MRTLSRLAAAGGALLALALAAPAANADSIAYVKDGDVWLSTTDGGRQYQVTDTGGYADVSQADDGTMIALNGVRLHRLDRTGKVLADFDTPVSDTRPVGSRVFHGPFDPAVSPDGTKVAYTYYYMTQSQNPGCLPPTCVVAINEGGTGYSHADRQTGWDEPGLGRHSGWRYPIWVDDDTTVMSDPTHLPNKDIIVDTISDGPPGMLHAWTSDLQVAHVGHGDVTRDRRKMAFVTGEADETLSVYHVPSFPDRFGNDGEPPAGTDPHICYRYSGPNGGKFATPTFSPDGRRLAWAWGDGIAIVDVPDFGGGCTTEGATPSAATVIPGGSEPDWGPADVPAGRAGQGGGPAAGGLAVAAGKAKLRKALKAASRSRWRFPAPARWRSPRSGAAAGWPPASAR